MRRKSRIVILFAMVLLMLIPGMTAEAKTKPKLAAKKKTMTVGQTYKLKLNHGDIKATQGDTGHAQTDMITEIYSHILDEDRKVNAQKFEAAFYKNPDLRKSGPPASDAQTNSGDIDLNIFIKKLKDSPELATTLAQLLVQ